MVTVIGSRLIYSICSPLGPTIVKEQVQDQLYYKTRRQVLDQSTDTLYSYAASTENLRATETIHMAAKMTKLREPKARSSFWTRSTELGCYILLFAALALGGAPNGTGLRVFAICVLAALLLPIAISAKAADRFSELPWAAKVCAIMVPAIPLLQLIPLPPAIWEMMPGRDLSARIFDLMGTRESWHPLSVVPRQTLFGAAMALPAAAIFLSALTLNEKGQQRAGLALIAIISLSVFVGFVQFATSGSTLDFYDTAHRGSFLGFFANRNHQGLLMGVGAVFAIFLIRLRIEDRRVALAVAVLIALAFLIAAIATLSRAGIALTILGASAALYINFIHGRLRPLFVGGGVLITFATIYFVSFSSTTQAALDRFSNFGEDERWDIWTKSWPLIEQYGLAGAGVGSYTAVYPTIEKLEHVTRFYYNRMHNDYLELTLETGVLGVFALLLLSFAVVSRCLTLVKGQSAGGQLSAAGGITIALFAMHSIIDYPLRTQAGTVIFALALALFISSPRPRKSSEAEPDSVARWSDRSTKVKFAGGGIQSLIGVSVLAFVQIQTTAEMPEEIANASLIGLAEGEPLPVSELGRAKRYLSRHPLDQSLLNTVFTSEVRSGSVSPQNAAYLGALNDLGWRDTTSQQNLLYAAVNRGDLLAALNSIDAMLRRSRLIDELLPVLSQFETDPDGTALLAERIMQDPPWRQRYFDLAYPLEDPARLDARLALFETLKQAGFEISRRDKMTTLRAMVRAGRQDEVAQMARLEMPANAQNQLIYDSNFDRTLGLSTQARAEPLPYEWQLTNRAGVSTQIYTEDWGSRLVLRWNGRGAPVIARALTFAKRGEVPRLTVTVSGGSRSEDLEALRFSLMCAGEREILFERALGSSQASPSVAVSNVVYQASRQTACDYPVLAILGRPRPGDRGADLSVDSILMSLP